ncbi:50S ribosomal protein L1 [Candidatus Falkowbacteria bacterium CG23_combo_of_CG06-09_8_20_14_all_49_15]|uniref:Large ribosomal subunit protein uL1 n=1 Tax=Candidatus Falkowbacteria bacterium CG23_combo_of_CG06-09_8_20_14_all_49_15 TaxID=1974572 RepID=A0A2G9ZL82_9BACT|nr:MAG: 50S ribosomal protein L1 [Candidatus Falkowbacteria bacterium CG23_combo_of_CG06-09_8_20_14_all_49_15]
MSKEKKDIAKKETSPEQAAFDKKTAYPIAEAIKIAQSLSKTKFDAAVEVHFRLGIDPKKGEQQVRGAASLPHGTGKTIRIAAFVTPGQEAAAKEAGADLAGGDELIAEIKKTEKTDFAVAVAEPEMMKKLAPIAKILGTRGLMPSPKNQTVSPDPANVVAELKRGKINFKSDDTGNVHAAIGKVSFAPEKLGENFQVLLEQIKKAKPSSSKGLYLKNATLSTSMGPGIKIAL